MEDKKNNNISNSASAEVQSSAVLPESVEAMLKDKHFKIWNIVDISEFERKELNPFSRFRDYAFSIIWISNVDPRVYEEMTDTIIKLRQVLENQNDFTILNKVPNSGTSDNYDLPSKKAA